MKEGGFILRSWVSNCAELNSQFEIDDSGVSHSMDHERVLGYKYFPESDKLSVAETFTKSNDSSITKRSVLAYISRVFDPLGLYVPVTVRGKIFIQKLWKAKLCWDDRLPLELENEWNLIRRELEQLPQVGFDRRAYNNEELSLIICCDSSKEIYGFCCYTESTFDSQRRFNLVFAKAKSAPLKSKSLPTLELMAVFLALKCLPSILSALNCQIRSLTISVDAQIVLSWILTSNVKTKNVFARNRIIDISNLRAELKTKYALTCNFTYLPSEENPADLLTRGISKAKWVEKMDFWVHGPNFFRNELKDWPKRNLNCLSEESKLLTLNSAKVQNIDSVNFSSLFSIKKYSSLAKTLNVTATILLFIAKLKRKTKTKLECVNKTRKYMVQTEQHKHFSLELKFLKTKQGTVPLLVKNLSLFLDNDQIIRSKGRLENCAYLSYNVRNPVLLPKHSFLTELVIVDAHEECKHLGVATTLSAVRKKGIWIPQGRTVVRSIVSRCVVCKKINSFSFKYPKVPDYVSDKVNFTHPFKYTGIDTTGHLFVKLNDKVTKMYILVFTCLNIRAVHLELLPSLNCNDFLLAFIRFCNLFTIPDTVYSDNAKTFVQGMGILSNSSVNDEFEQHLIKNNIRHLRIPLYAAWIGSAWERLIRIIKNCLHKAMGRKQMNYFELITLLSDIENAINSRPLTYLSENLDAITPNSFIKYSAGGNVMLDGVAGAELAGPDRSALVRTLEKRDETFAYFRELWVEDYLLSLRENSRDVYQFGWENKIDVGDVVLMSSPNKPRYQWQMGRVQQLLPGKDGVVRTVKMMRPDRSTGVYYIRMLYPLELSVAPVLTAPPDEPQERADSNPAIESRPQKRAAARICLQRLAASN